MLGRKLGIAIMAFALGIAAIPADAGTVSQCDTVPDNVVVNCGFELSSGGAPAGWTLDSGFTTYLGSFNMVQSALVNSGDAALMFGDFDSQGPAGISQSFATLPGAGYTVSFYAKYNTSLMDPLAFLKATVNGTQKFTLSGDDGAPRSGFANYHFNFTGTGADTLAFFAQTDPSEWFLDDISVTDPAPDPTVPEPGTWALVTGGLLLASLRSRFVSRRQ